MALTKEQLIAFLANELGLDGSEIDDDSLLFTDGLLDSFSLTEVVAFLEDKGCFKMAVTDVTLANLDSVDRMMAFVARKQRKRGPHGTNR